MTIKRDNIIVAMVIAVVAVVLTHAFTIGYGIGFQRQGKMLQTEVIKQYTPSHLTVHYERKMCDKQDILRLEIDTTYRTIGKGSFVYEVICDRTISLYGSDGKPFTTAQAKRCFIEGANRKWTQLAQHNMIEGYNCWASVTNDDNTSWQAWYTTELPHCSKGATITDGLNGLILHVEETKGEYSLHAKKIDIKTA